MTREEWKERLPFIQAFVEGKTVQCRLSGEWEDVDNLLVMNAIEHYRIKPESETRPFKNIDELIEANNNARPEHTMPLIWIENRFTEEVELITTYDYANSFHDDDRVETSTRVLTMDDLYREYKFLNGDICGVKI